MTPVSYLRVTNLNSAGFQPAPHKSAGKKFNLNEWIERRKAQGKSVDVFVGPTRKRK